MGRVKEIQKISGSKYGQEVMLQGAGGQSMFYFEDGIGMAFSRKMP